MPNSTFGQDTQEKTKIVTIDGVKVAVVPYGSFNAVLTRLVICDSVWADNGYNVALIDSMEVKLNVSAIVIAQKDTIINNLTKIVKTDSVLSEFDKSIIDQQQAEIKKEQRKVKIVGGVGLLVLILSLIL